MSCAFCGKDSAYIYNVCGKMLCSEHVEMRTVCASCIKRQTFKYRIERLRQIWREIEFESLSRDFGERRNNSRLIENL